MIRPSRSWSRREMRLIVRLPEGASVGAALLLTVPETGWRATDTTYRRGDGVFAARFPSDDLGLSRFRAATQKSIGFPWLEIILALRRLSQMGQGLPSMRRAERRQPFNTGHDAGSHSTGAASSTSKEACDGVPAKPRSGPRRTVTTTTRMRARTGSEVKSVRNDRWRKDPIRSERGCEEAQGGSSTEVGP
jgi:hypothetical protein